MVFAKLTVYFFSLLCLVSCIDIVDLEIPAGEIEGVAINAKLVKGTPSSISITAQNVFAFDGNSKKTKIISASLIDKNGLQKSLEKVTDNEYGLEFNDSDRIKIEFENSYQIRVTLLDGRIIESDFEEIQRAGAIDKLDFSVEERDIFTENLGLVSRERAIVNLSSSISNLQDQPKRLRWYLERTYKLLDSPEYYLLRDPKNNTVFLKNKTCFVSDIPALDNVVLFDGLETNQDKAEFNYELFNGTISDYRFLDTMYFTVVQEAMSERSFEYFSKTSELLSLTGSMFEPKGGKIRSNLVNTTDPEDEIFGFFYATEQIKTRLKITPDFIGEVRAVGPIGFNYGEGRVIPLCPGVRNLTDENWRPGMCPSGFNECCDCLFLPNSTLTRPDFF